MFLEPEGMDFNKIYTLCKALKPRRRCLFTGFHAGATNYIKKGYTIFTKRLETVLLYVYTSTFVKYKFKEVFL